MKTQLEVPIEIRARLRELQAELERERGRPVTVAQAIGFLLDTRAELARPGEAQYGGGT